MHRRRRTVLISAVSAALSSTRLTVTGLGRSMVSQAKEKHCIKRADRLLSNGKLQQENGLVYQAMTQQIVGAAKRPVILVDWSTLDDGAGLFLLRASTPVRGRALTLYEEVHTLADKEKPRVHQKFLAKLHQFLPAPSCPIVITDAGFRTPWFKEIEKLGWDWVGRIRNRHMVNLGTGWISCKVLYKQATLFPRALGQVLMTQKNPINCSLVIYKALAKGRIEKNRRGVKTRRLQSRRNAACQREPWLLATSLTGPDLAKQVVQLYKTRMQIEEAFRDLKSARYGLGLSYSGTKKALRMRILVMIGSIALWLSWLLGKATEASGQHRNWQANTIRHRTVLSPIFIGLQVYNDGRMVLTSRLLAIAKNFLNSLVLDYDYA